MQRLDRAAFLDLRKKSAVGPSTLCKVHTHLPWQEDKAKGVDGLPVCRTSVSIGPTFVKTE